MQLLTNSIIDDIFIANHHSFTHICENMLDDAIFAKIVNHQGPVLSTYFICEKGMDK